MYITVSEFCKITGIPRDTVYGWKYADNFPPGLRKSDIGDERTTILEVKKEYEHFEKIRDEKKRQ